MTKQMSRREFAALFSGATAAGVAGCYSRDGDSEQIAGVIGGGPEVDPIAQALLIPYNELVKLSDANGKYTGIRWESGGTLRVEDGEKLTLHENQ